MLDLLAHAAEAAHAGEEHAEAAAYGVSALTPGFFVALAMLVVFGIMLKAKVPAMIAGMLDGQIAQIRKQLDEAKALRAEAEKLRDDYAARAKAAERDIAEMRKHAEVEAERIVEKAQADAVALMARHKTLAEDKISAAERAAVADLRAKAAEAATAAAAKLIADKHDAGADKSLVDKAIAGI